MSKVSQHVTIHHNASHHNTQQHITTHYNTFQHNTRHRKTSRHITTHYNQHIYVSCIDARCTSGMCCLTYSIVQWHAVMWIHTTNTTDTYTQYTAHIIHKTWTHNTRNTHMDKWSQKLVKLASLFSGIITFEILCCFQQNKQSRHSSIFFTNYKFNMNLWHHLVGK